MDDLETVRRVCNQVQGLNERLSVRRCNEEERREVLRHISNQTDFTTMFKVGTWVNVPRKKYGQMLALVKEVFSYDELRVSVIRKCNPTRNLESNACETESNVAKGRAGKHTSTTGKVILRFTDDDGVDKLLEDVRIVGTNSVTLARPSAYDVADYTRLGFDTRAITNESFAVIGEAVCVRSGVMKGQRGLIVRLEGSGAVLRLEYERQQWECYITFADYERCFAVGDCVAVEIGPKKGVQGMICGLAEPNVEVWNEVEGTIVSFDAEIVKYELMRY